HIAVVKWTIFQRACRLVVRFGTRGFMYWMVVWSLCLLGLLGSFTSRGLGLGAGMLGVAGWRRGALFRVGFVLRGAGCTAAGTWRAGAGMGFWSLWGARTIRLRFAASALSQGRSRQRCCGMKACRRLLWLRAWIGRGASSLLATLFWRRVRLRMRRRCGRMLGRAFPTTWCRLRSLFWIVCRLPRTGRFAAGGRPAPRVR